MASPEKLKARLVKLQEEVEEAKSSTASSYTSTRVWESLVARAQNMPTFLNWLNQDLEGLVAKTKKKDESRSCLEGIQENISRQKQALKEASAKHQNLMRQMNQRVHLSEEMKRNIHQLEQRVEGRRMMYQIRKSQADLEARKIQYRDDFERSKNRLELAIKHCVQQQTN